MMQVLSGPRPAPEHVGRLPLDGCPTTGRAAEPSGFSGSSAGAAPVGSFLPDAGPTAGSVTESSEFSGSSVDSRLSSLGACPVDVGLTEPSREKHTQTETYTSTDARDVQHDERFCAETSVPGPGGSGGRRK